MSSFLHLNHLIQSTFSFETFPITQSFSLNGCVKCYFMFELCIYHLWLRSKFDNLYQQGNFRDTGESCSAPAHIKYESWQIYEDSLNIQKKVGRKE